MSISFIGCAVLSFETNWFEILRHGWIGSVVRYRRVLGLRFGSAFLFLRCRGSTTEQTGGLLQPPGQKSKSPCGVGQGSEKMNTRHRGWGCMHSTRCPFLKARNGPVAIEVSVWVEILRNKNMELIHSSTRWPICSWSRWKIPIGYGS